MRDLNYNYGDLTFYFKISNLNCRIFKNQLTF